jgi:hypothetical protein
LRDLASQDSNINIIVNNYVHILENDFRGIDNIDNITGEAGEITNGIRSISLINKVTKPSNSNFSLNYYERSGSILTKAHELYLTGIKDPDTQVKHYHGLIDAWVYNGTDTISGKDPGPHQECFTFMYFMTDNTMTKVERAFLIAACQPTSANYSDLYTGNKGDIQFAEVSLPFNGFFINNDFVYQKAQDMLLAMRNPANITNTRVIVDSNNFKYNAIAQAGLKNGTNQFSTPGFWSESEGRIDDEKFKSSTAGKINSEERSYVGWTPTEAGQPTGGQNFKYNDLVASMSKAQSDDDNAGEHFINNAKGNDASGSLYNTRETYATEQYNNKLQTDNNNSQGF